MNKILIDMVTGTVLNYDEKVVIVDVETLTEEETALLEEWYEGGNDSDIIELGSLRGTVITDYLPSPTQDTNE